METPFHPLNRLSPPLPASFFSSLQHHFGGPPPQHDLKPRIHVLPEHQQRQVPPPLRIHEAHQPGRGVLGVLQLNGADGVGIQLQLEAAVQRPAKKEGIWDGDGKTHGKTYIISVWNSRMLETYHLWGKKIWKQKWLGGHVGHQPLGNGRCWSPHLGIPNLHPTAWWICQKKKPWMI